MSRLAVLYHITRDLSIRKSQSCLQQDGLGWQDTLRVSLYIDDIVAFSTMHVKLHARLPGPIG